MNLKNNTDSQRIQPKETTALTNRQESQRATFHDEGVQIDVTVAQQLPNSAQQISHMNPDITQRIPSVALQEENIVRKEGSNSVNAVQQKSIAQGPIVKATVQSDSPSALEIVVPVVGSKDEAIVAVKVQHSPAIVQNTAEQIYDSKLDQGRVDKHVTAPKK